MRFEFARVCARVGWQGRWEPTPNPQTRTSRTTANAAQQQQQIASKYHIANSRTRPTRTLMTGGGLSNRRLFSVKSEVRSVALITMSLSGYTGGPGGGASPRASASCRCRHSRRRSGTMRDSMPAGRRGCKDVWKSGTGCTEDCRGGDWIGWGGEGWGGIGWAVVGWGQGHMVEAGGEWRKGVAGRTGGLVSGAVRSHSVPLPIPHQVLWPGRPTPTQPRTHPKPYPTPSSTHTQLPPSPHPPTAPHPPIAPTHLAAGRC